MRALSGGKGGEERERESRNVFCKECLMIKRTWCNFLCWLGSLGENVVMFVKNKRLYDMYGYERVCNMLEEKKGKPKESTNT